MTSGPSDYLAAERTFLAWIRTGLALMGLGFVVARFGMFLRALQVGQPTPAVQTSGLSMWFGTTLIVLGVIVNILSAWNHVRLVQDLNRGGSAFNRPSSLAIIVAVILAVVGLAMAIYLISVGEPSQGKLSRRPGQSNDIECRHRTHKCAQPSSRRSDG
jgi:putative membrane protein